MPNLTNVLLSLVAAGAALGAMALADPYEASAEPEETTTVEVDSVLLDFPVCHLEDCSDQAEQVGVWISNEGISYLIVGESTTRITR
ncbi:hypothetical protein SEA_DARTHPHADER_86 [Mycobacterium phage DarthPhader]|uniref:Uncharacterized protein n=1 Tax=Mycobacterium phage DarthPhader TaxID=1912975 RepID=A0A1I9S432_9CAUD|nr:hypothetical protein KIV60_gp15 [Mycobacterium phage DarthPhader]AOZ61326.1 hypothetical protein SEA_DARTHPHADER_86 [Mycobacterium phage DarthPhader]